MFLALSRVELKTLLANAAPDVHHSFPGEHPLGGERHSRESLRRWFERLGRLYPGHQFTVHRVLSRGWPWDTWIAVQWSGHLTPAVGQPYVNDGAHWIHLRWGKVDQLHAYLDTQAIDKACREMAAAGIEEASAPPIADRR